MKSPFHHIRHPEGLFEHFNKNIHHAFAVFALAIIGMLWGTSNILTQASASWQWGGFLNSDFWDQNPSDANIMYALFGDGTPGATAYTRLRTGSCIPTSVQTLSPSFAGFTGTDNTIYILNPGTYTLAAPIVMGGCSALLGKGEVFIKPANSNIASIIDAAYKDKIIMDNIKINGNGAYTGIDITSGSNIMINTTDISDTLGGAIISMRLAPTNAISNSKIYNNEIGILGIDIHINNSLLYNNAVGIKAMILLLNNSQVFNNTTGAEGLGGWFPHIIQGGINNSLFYNNNLGLYSFDITFNNAYFYNNDTGVDMFPGGYFTGYGSVKFFGNTTGMTNGAIIVDANPPISSRAPGQIDTSSTLLDYERFTNPQNGSGQYLLSGTNRLSLRGIQTSFNQNKKPIRYIFGGNILKQIAPVTFGSVFDLFEYGVNGSDYMTARYITEPDSTLPAIQQLLVNQYFGSGSPFTQNRQTNGCSLSAFQIVYLNPGTFSSTYNFQDHTLYILTGGEYRSAIGGLGNGFVFNGNCIAVIGTNDTRFTKSNVLGMSSILYANNKRNIIIDDIKVDGFYFSTMLSSPKAQMGINFDGTTNNTTINNAQAYNTSSYGIYLGLGSHHATVINTQAFNNGIAGIHLYYSSNYNVINNTQTYNNGLYGIRFANGSNRNTMNNFQAYNNDIGIFGDFTTKENVLNRAAIYNNSTAGIYFKNASGNVLNDVRIYNNGVGIRTLYSSLGNKFYGDLKMFDNGGGDFDGTDSNDGYLSPGTAGLFPYAGILSTGTTTMSCIYATNPTLSGNGLMLLGGNCTHTGVTLFESSYNTYVNYAFGLNVYKQKVPVRYDTGDVLVQIPSQYDPNKYIAEIFAIRDTTPEAVNFIGSGTAQLNSWYSTNVYTAGVLNIPVVATLSFVPATTSGYLTISGINVGLTGIVNNGDTIKITLLTQTGYNQTTTGTITLGSITTGFIVTTRGAIQTPTLGSLAFTNFTSMPFNTFTESTTTVAGLETGVYASLNFDPLTTSGRLEIYSGTALLSSGTTGLLVYNGNQIKAVAKSSSGFAQLVTGYVTLGLGTGTFTLMTKGSDSTPPTTPVLTYPLSGEALFFVSFAWNASVDTGSGLEGYAYEIANDVNFISIVNTGFIANSTGTLGSPNTGFNQTSSIYYLRMKAKDRDGNYSARTNTGYFTVVNFNNRNFTDKNNANLTTQYDSNHIILTGIKPGLMVWATVSASGTLSKNGSNIGTGTFVQNGDVLFISLKSSNLYNTTVASVLTIANRAIPFRVTTKIRGSGCTLSSGDTATIQTIFNSLVQNYTGDANKFDTFLYTMQSMLADQIDFTNDCNLQYLQNLISAAIGGNVPVNTGSHIAPNCKEYPVNYDITRTAYLSPAFKVVTYFANRDSLARYIDSKNPGDCHINTYGASSLMFINTDPSKHIAPNGKIYTIQFGGQGYTSPGFTAPKYFGSIGELRNFIDNNNFPPAIRSHQVDTSFTPQTYTAPNGKQYTIYRTDRGYMSYKLMKVRYFSSLVEIQAFINQNNR